MRTCLLLAVAALVLAALVLAAGCSDTDEPDATATATTAVQGTATTAAPATGAGAPQSTGSPATTESPAVGRPGPDTAALVEVATFEQPTDLTWWPEEERMLVAEKTGRLYSVSADGASPSLVLDLSGEVSTDSERGLLGTAVSPDGATLYASWTDAGGTSHVTAHPLGGQLALDPAERSDVITVEQPFANHNGGDLLFTSGGHLLWSLGDGGSAGDPNGNGQDPTTLLGALVRIDPDPAGGYTIPDTNPFADGDGGAPELFVWGLRNPWRISVDRATGDLWIADVGQGDYEEVDRLGAGESGVNFGWNCLEGVEPFADCEAPGARAPELVYDHSEGSSITGGYVYRGEEIADLAGNYVFGDYGSGTVWFHTPGSGERIDSGLHVDALTTFGEDGSGELWAAGLGGTVFRLVAG
jgi:glucose/arabinose dehydrogenase